MIAWHPAYTSYIHAIASGSIENSGFIAAILNRTIRPYTSYYTSNGALTIIGSVTYNITFNPAVGNSNTLVSTYPADYTSY